MFDVPRENPQEKAREWLKALKTTLYRAKWLIYTDANAGKWQKLLVRQRDFFEVYPLPTTRLLSLCTEPKEPTQLSKAQK